MNERLLGIDGRLQGVEQRLARIEEDVIRPKSRLQYSYRRSDEKYQHLIKPTYADAQSGTTDAFSANSAIVSSSKGLRSPSSLITSFRKRLV